MGTNVIPAFDVDIGNAARRRVLLVLIREQRGICHYCKQSTPRHTSTVDHVKPRSRGGTDARENLVMACKPCNRAKGDMSVDEFRRWVRQVAAALGKVAES